MRKLVAFHDGQAVTTSIIIAKGTGNEHRAVLQLLRTYLADLEVFGRVAFEMRPFETKGGTQTREIAILNERQATLLITYMRNNEVVRAFKLELVRAFYEMAETLRHRQTSTLDGISDPITRVAVLAAIEVDRLKQQTAQLAQRQEDIEHRVAAVELQHRSGVPTGYLSKAQAHQIYGRGLSKDVFHAVLAKLGVQTKPYVHLTDDGYEVATFAYLDDMIPEAIQHFLDDAQQATSKTCVSPLLDGKMFRYVKAIDVESA